jgi:hypothetical protein
MGDHDDGTRWYDADDLAAERHAGVLAGLLAAVGLAVAAGIAAAPLWLPAW